MLVTVGCKPLSRQLIAVGRVLNPHLLLKAKIIVVSLGSVVRLPRRPLLAIRLWLKVSFHCHEWPDLIPCIEGLYGKAVDDHVVEMATRTFSQKHGTVLFSGTAGAVHRYVVEGGL